MADQSHLDILKEGVEAWNEWRERNPSIDPDLSGANLSRAYLYGASPLMAALSEDSRYGVNLSATTLNAADLTEAWLIDANLFGAALFRANLSRAALSEANLSDADLTRSALVETNLTGTTLTACHIYGISAWDLKLEGAKQHNLNVSNFGEPAIMVDNLEVAQFIYLLLNNEKIRQVIDTITSKVVLILGRFTSERKAVLDAIRDSLRQRDYLPVLFDFDKPGPHGVYSYLGSHGSVYHRGYHRCQEHTPGVTGHRAEPSVGTRTAVGAGFGP
jgi:hypothetical protein